MLRKFYDMHGFSPTLSELCKEIGVRSINTVVQYLNALETKGYIIRRKHAKRNIELRDADYQGAMTTMVNIPVVASVGCDDLSVFADDQRHDEFIQVDKQLVDKKNGQVVIVRAVGESMADAGIQNGDYVLVETTENVESGDRIVVIIGDMITIKRLERKDNATILWPESSDPIYKPIIMREDFKVAGKVLNIIQNPRNDDIQVIPENSYGM